MPAEPEAEKFAHGLALLLKEYAGKLEDRISDLREARERCRERKVAFFDSKDFQVFMQRFSAVDSALLTATREASQLAEQGAVSDLTRIELQLRLAEVEGLIHSWRQAMTEQ
jgi:hypothetical protein